jgi:hypothetical protein
MMWCAINNKFYLYYCDKPFKIAGTTRARSETLFWAVAGEEERIRAES